MIPRKHRLVPVLPMADPAASLKYTAYSFYAKTTPLSPTSQVFQQERVHLIELLVVIASSPLASCAARAG